MGKKSGRTVSAPTIVPFPHTAIPSIPSTTQAPPTQTPQARPTAKPMRAATGSIQATEQISIVLQIAKQHEGYVARYINCRRADVKSLSLRQRTALARLTAGLSHSKATLEDGRFVNDRGRAMRWLLERVADELDKISAAVE